MRAQVLSDPALAKQAGRFVWLSLNTEDRRNAPFLEHAGIEGLPTYLVVDAADESIALRWMGSATVPQFEKLLDDGEHAVSAPGEDPAAAALARADRLSGERKPAEAAAAYREALRVAPPDWPRRSRTLESLLIALQSSGGLQECADTARVEGPRMERGPSFANAVATGLGCAEAAPSEATWRDADLAALTPMVEEALGLEGVLADDRSSLFGALLDRREEQGDDAGAKQLAGRWLDFLEGESAKAAGPEARAAFDSHRVSAALALGDPARAVPALLASERDLPDDYNPPARLALLYRAMGSYDEALAASDRALGKADGPRKLRIYNTRADILLKRGDKAEARTTLEAAIHFADALPAGQRPGRLVDQLQADLAAIH